MCIIYLSKLLLINPEDWKTWKRVRMLHVGNCKLSFDHNSVAGIFPAFLARSRGVLRPVEYVL